MTHIYTVLVLAAVGLFGGATILAAYPVGKSWPRPLDELIGWAVETSGVTLLTYVFYIIAGGTELSAIRLVSVVAGVVGLLIMCFAVALYNRSEHNEKNMRLSVALGILGWFLFIQALAPFMDASSQSII